MKVIAAIAIVFTAFVFWPKILKSLGIATIPQFFRKEVMVNRQKLLYPYFLLGYAISMLPTCIVLWRIGYKYHV